MKKFILTLICLYAATVAPASAQTQGRHSLGDMYTKALNMIESCGLLHNLRQERLLAVTDMHMDHGQIFVTVSGDKTSIITYDPIANKIVYPEGGVD